MIKAIIFDLFGVLLTDALKQISDPIRKSNPAGYEEIKRLIQMASLGLIEREESNQRIADILGIDVSDFQKRVNDGEVLNQELLDYIEQLRGTYKTAILSNISRGGLKRRFNNGELDGYFDIMVASGDEGVAKPEPEIYERTADRLDVRFDECVFTDDIPAYCEAARAVGMRAIHYEDFDSFKRQLETILQAG